MFISEKIQQESVQREPVTIGWYIMYSGSEERNVKLELSLSWQSLMIIYRKLRSSFN